MQQGELLQRVEQERASLSANTAEGTRESLKAQTEAIRKKIAANGDADDQSLQKQLQVTENRLNRLENEGRIAETIVHTYGPSVCLLHVVVAFRDKDSGQVIRISTDANGKPQVDDKGMMSLETDGNGTAAAAGRLRHRVSSRTRWPAAHESSRCGAVVGQSGIEAASRPGRCGVRGVLHGVLPRGHSGHRGQGRTDFAGCRSGNPQAAERRHRRTRRSCSSMIGVKPV